MDIKAPVKVEAAVSPAMLENTTLSGDDCHCIVPVLPVRDTVELAPVHIVAGEAAAVPPAEAGFTFTVATTEVAEEHTPLVTIAL